jgi:hypothetical protein
MSIHRASQLTIWGFCVLYAGLMGLLVAVNAPAVSPFWTPALLAFSATAFAGLVAMLTGRLARVNGDDGPGGPL